MLSSSEIKTETPAALPLNFKCMVIEPTKTAEQHMHELLEIHNQFYTGVYYDDFKRKDY